FPLLLAAIIHYEQHLRSTLCPNHPIFKARVFSDNELLDKQQGATVLAIGDPPNSKQVSELRELVTNLHKEINQLKEVMSVKLPSKVAQKVVNELQQHFVVSIHDIDSRMADLRASMIVKFRNAMHPIQKLLQLATLLWLVSIVSGVQLSGVMVSSHMLFLKIEIFRLLQTLGFVLTDRSASITISNQSTKCGTSRLRTLMQHLEQIAKDAGAQADDVNNLFDTVFAEILSQLYTVTPKRAEDVSCGTEYNRPTQYQRRQQST
ncbi:hypothetical protein GN958_ATG17744, partial [Phytophthora infestans]